mmetsp:Transcript_95057/g.307667  ORF Transcript_95057/g.307667 Transcript_95057/m.307667 type:complete len:237 (-) Transcript_95057:2193-2903(-)
MPRTQPLPWTRTMRTRLCLTRPRPRGQRRRPPRRRPRAVRRRRRGRRRWCRPRPLRRCLRGVSGGAAPPGRRSSRRSCLPATSGRSRRGRPAQPLHPPSPRSLGRRPWRSRRKRGSSSSSHGSPPAKSSCSLAPRRRSSPPVKRNCSLAPMRLPGRRRTMLSEPSSPSHMSPPESPPNSPSGQLLWKISPSKGSLPEERSRSRSLRSRRLPTTSRKPTRTSSPDSSRRKSCLSSRS